MLIVRPAFNAAHIVANRVRPFRFRTLDATARVLRLRMRRRETFARLRQFSIDARNRGAKLISSRAQLIDQDLCGVARMSMWMVGCAAYGARLSIDKACAQF